MLFMTFEPLLSFGSPFQPCRTSMVSFNISPVSSSKRPVLPPKMTEPGLLESRRPIAQRSSAANLCDLRCEKTLVRCWRAQIMRAAARLTLWKEMEKNTAVERMIATRAFYAFDVLFLKDVEGFESESFQVRVVCLVAKELVVKAEPLRRQVGGNDLVRRDTVLHQCTRIVPKHAPNLENLAAAVVAKLLHNATVFVGRHIVAYEWRKKE